MRQGLAVDENYISVVADRIIPDAGEVTRRSGVVSKRIPLNSVMLVGQSSSARIFSLQRTYIAIQVEITASENLSLKS